MKRIKCILYDEGSIELKNFCKTMIELGHEIDTIFSDDYVVKKWATEELIHCDSLDNDRISHENLYNRLYSKNVDILFVFSDKLDVIKKFTEFKGDIYLRYNPFMKAPCKDDSIHFQKIKLWLKKTFNNDNFELVEQFEQQEKNNLLHFITSVSRGAIKILHNTKAASSTEITVSNLELNLSEIDKMSYFVITFVRLLSLYQNSESIKIGFMKSYPFIENLLGLPLFHTEKVYKIDHLEHVGLDQAFNLSEILLVEGKQAERTITLSFFNKMQYSDPLVLIPQSDSYIQGSNNHFGFENLRITFNISKNKINLSMLYNPQFYEASILNNMSFHFSNLLNRSIKEPWDKVSYLRQEEEKILVKEWGQGVNIVINESITHAFEKIVEKFYNNPALFFNGENISYGLLNEKADRIAQYLIQKNQKKLLYDQKIAIFMEKSPHLIFTIFGILKAGAAYVPLSNKLPDERLKFIVEDSQSKMLLTDKQNFHQALTLFQDVICVEDLNLHKDNTSHAKLPDNYNGLAYIIYTSGSTGSPKGVAIKHYGVVNIAREQARLCHVSEQEKVLQFSSVHFDASVWDIFGALLNGALLCLPGKLELESSDALSSFIQLNDISYLTVTPMYLDTLSFKALKNVNTIVVMGEKAPKNILDKWSVNRNLINAYGPSEATVCSTLSQYEVNSLPTQIGKPLANCSVYVLDKYKNLVPIGVPGELCIAGIGLPSGYYNLEQLTADKFIKNPFSENALEERMYCSGDLVRWLPNGELDFIGRIDRQVKINGQRVELSEIETHLNKLESIKTCFVNILSKNNQNILVAYYEPQKQLDTKCMQLRFHEEIFQELKKWLPNHMLPHYFVPVEKLPLNQNGKVDVSKLPEIAYYEAYGSEDYILPVTETQKIISQLVCELLGAEKVSIEHNFFRLGMTSLSAILLASAIQKKLKIKCSAQQIYEKETISSLAKWLDQNCIQKSLETLSNKAVSSHSMPLSSSQQRLWFLYQMEGKNNVTYNMPLAYKIKGKLDINLLEKSLNKLIERHDMLKTVFPSKNGVPYLKKLLNFKLNIQVTQITHDEIDMFLSVHARTPFDLEKGPLFRAAIGRIDDENFVLILNKHNIVTDGWSEGIILHELSIIYHSFKNEINKDLLLPQNSFFYEFSQEESKKINAGYYDSKMDFWKKYLEGFEELKMPTDFPRDSFLNREGLKIYKDFNKQFKNKVSDLCNYYQVTPFMFFLSIFNLLLHRYTGQEDILIGTVNAAREDMEFKNVVGFFANTFVLRNKIDTHVSFPEFLQSIKRNCLNVYPNQDLPFDQLIDKLKINRDNHKTPIFQIMLVMQDANEDYQLNLEALKLERLPVHPGSSMLDLTMNITYTQSAFKLDIEYDTKLFKKETVEHFLIHYENFLSQALENPNRKLSDINMLSHEEGQTLMAYSVGNYRDFEVPKDIVSNFEINVKKFPSNIAVRFGFETITYEELNNRSNKLARGILARLEGKQAQCNGQKRIGVCVARSIETIISIFGILKSGHIFVPIAPEYPPERINMIANDADLSLLIINKTLNEETRSFLRGNDILDFEKIIGADQYDCTNLNVYSDPNLPAYIIYTSGSTGKPKGVVVAHKSIINTICATKERVKIAQTDRLISVSSINFDMFICDIFLPLLNGAECVLCEIPKIRDPLGFVEYFKQVQATFIEATPSFLGMVVDILPYPEHPLTILTGGEALTNTLVQKLKRVAQTIFNLYGPTEAAVWSTISSNLATKETIDIGTPLANVECYILNKDLQLQAKNITGELYISGPGIALGYWKNEPLTQSTFLPNPFRSGATIYKTGDLAYWDDNGIINFVGREDRQVKIRGTRIELGEIEYVIRTYEPIEDCVVTTYEHDNIKNLVAYLIPRKEHKLDESYLIKELKAYLNTILSAPMIPSSFLILDRIPLNANNKLDYKSLPSPIRTASQDKNIKKPRTHFENKIEKIWSAILGHNGIDIEENFFDLGGNSITIPRVIFHTNEALKTAITIREFMQYPTIMSLCAYLENKHELLQV